MLKIPSVFEFDGIKHLRMREKFRKECYRKITTIVNTELKTISGIEVINTLDIPAEIYDFNTIYLSIGELCNLGKKNMKTR